MDIRGLYHFFDLFWVKKVLEGPTFSEANFGVGTNSRLVTLNARCLVRKRTQIQYFFEKMKRG